MSQSIVVKNMEGYQNSFNSSRTFMIINDTFYGVTDGVNNETIPYQHLGEDGCPLQMFHHVDYTQISAVYCTIIVAYILVMMMAIFGNMLVIWTVWRNVHMHTVTNYYIVNLATSDFLVSLIVMPLKLLEYTSPCKWHIFSTDSLCAFLSYVQPIFVFASVLTLVAISLERYVLLSYLHSTQNKYHHLFKNYFYGHLFVNFIC